MVPRCFKRELQLPGRVVVEWPYPWVPCERHNSVEKGSETSMIIGTDRKHEVGKIYVGPVTDDNAVSHMIPFQVMRTATKEEWVQSVAECGAAGELIRQTLGHAPPPYFYDISID